MYEWEARPLRRAELIALDGLAALGYALVLLLLPGGGLQSLRPAWQWGLVVAGMAAPLAVRRLWPWTVFAIVLATSVVALAAGIVRDSFVGAAFALYVVALTTQRKRGRRFNAPVIGALSAAGILLATVVGTPAPQSRTIGALVLGVSLLGGAWTLGRAVRDRRAYAARAAEQLAERAVTEERLRIARELHDVVAHSMGVIAVKAAVANHVAETHPAEVRDALRVIETASRGALAEMRQLLGVLRSEDAPFQDASSRDASSHGAPSRDASSRDAPSHGASSHGASSRDAPSLAPEPSLPELVDRAALAGVRVDLHVRGLDGLPDGVRLATLRIVQESVTNVMKHAAPARARVSVVADGHEVAVEVVDDGTGSPAAGPGGHGLIGMRERVAMYSGSFSAGPRPEGGFAVSARLPYGTVSA